MRTKTPALEDRKLEAAARLFGTQRFHEVRMEDIAAEAEVGKGTIYRYFGDKEELYKALLARSSGQLLGRLHDELAHGDSPRVQLVRVVASVIGFFDERPHLFDLIQRAEVMQGPGFLWRETRLELIRLVNGLFEACKATGAFAIRDPELTTFLLLGGIRTVIRFGKQPRPRDLAEQIVDTFLHESLNSKNNKNSKN